MSDPKLHPALEPLSFLLGTWLGDGKGDYPTVEPFAYREQIDFSESGRPFLFYVQKTWDPETGHPLHSEAGYLRPVAEHQVELIIAQPTGITEILAGAVTGASVHLDSTSVGVSPTAKEVSTVRRTLVVRGDTLSYQLDMAAVGQDLQFHLAAELERQ